MSESFSKLNYDCWDIICSYISPNIKSLLNLIQVNKQLQNIITSSHVWTSLGMKLQLNSLYQKNWKSIVLKEKQLFCQICLNHKDIIQSQKKTFEWIQSTVDIKILDRIFTHEEKCYACYMCRFHYVKFNFNQDEDYFEIKEKDCIEKYKLTRMFLHESIFNLHLKSINRTKSLYDAKDIEILAFAFHGNNKISKFIKKQIYCDCGNSASILCNRKRCNWCCTSSKCKRHSKSCSQ